MSKIFSQENIWNALYAIASGLLTEIAYDELSNGNYKITFFDGEALCTQVGDLNFFLKIIIILALFLSFWVVFSILIPLIARFSNRFRYRNKPHFSRKTVIKVYKNVRSSLRTLDSVILPTHNYNLYTDDIFLLINKMYTTFCHKEARKQKTVQGAFRTKDTVNDIGKNISYWEYTQIIYRLKEHLNSIACIEKGPYDNAVLVKDIKVFQSYINELEKVTPAN